MSGKSGKPSPKVTARYAPQADSPMLARHDAPTTHKADLMRMALANREASPTMPHTSSGKGVTPGKEPNAHGASKQPPLPRPKSGPRAKAGGAKPATPSSSKAGPSSTGGPAKVGGATKLPPLPRPQSGPRAASSSGSSGRASGKAAPAAHKARPASAGGASKAGGSNKLPPLPRPQSGQRSASSGPHGHGKASRSSPRAAASSGKASSSPRSRQHGKKSAALLLGGPGLAPAADALLLGPSAAGTTVPCPIMPSGPVSGGSKTRTANYRHKSSSSSSSSSTSSSASSSSQALEAALGGGPSPVAASRPSGSGVVHSGGSGSVLGSERTRMVGLPEPLQNMVRVSHVTLEQEMGETLRMVADLGEPTAFAGAEKGTGIVDLPSGRGLVTEVPETSNTALASGAVKPEIVALFHPYEEWFSGPNPPAINPDASHVTKEEARAWAASSVPHANLCTTQYVSPDDPNTQQLAVLSVELKPVNGFFRALLRTKWGYSAYPLEASAVAAAGTGTVENRLQRYLRSTCQLGRTRARSESVSGMGQLGRLFRSGVDTVVRGKKRGWWLPADSATFPQALFKMDRHLGKGRQLTIGVILATSANQDESEMMLNEPTPNFISFLDTLGTRVTNVKGWTKFLGGLDPEVDSGGVYYTEWGDFEIVLHVACYMTADERRRFVGNDKVLLYYKDYDTDLFKPEFRGNVNSIGLVVQPVRDGSGHRVGCYHRAGIPDFGPKFGDQTVFADANVLRDALFTKAVNGHEASYRLLYARQIVRLWTESIQELMDAFPPPAGGMQAMAGTLRGLAARAKDYIVATASPSSTTRGSPDGGGEDDGSLSRKSLNDDLDDGQDVPTASLSPRATTDPASRIRTALEDARTGCGTLSMQELGITELESDWLSPLSNCGLSTVKLSHNQLHLWPGPIAFLSETLTSLHMSANCLKKVPPSIGRMTGLRELNLNGNALNSVPAQIAALQQLETLSLANNKIERLPTTIGWLRRLETLHLSGNEKLSFLPATLGNCVGMEVLDVSFCALRCLPDSLTLMTRLMQLNVSGNQLAEFPEACGRWARLSALNVADNQLRDLPLSIGHCEALHHMAGLDVSRNPWADASFETQFAIGADRLFLMLQRRMQTRSNARLPAYPDVPWPYVEGMPPLASVSGQRTKPQPKAPRANATQANGPTRVHQQGASPSPPSKTSPRSGRPVSPRSGRAGSPSLPFSSHARGGGGGGGGGEGASPKSVPKSESGESRTEALRRLGSQLLAKRIMPSLSLMQRRLANASSTTEVQATLGLVKQLKPLVLRIKKLLPEMPAMLPVSRDPSATALEKVRGLVAHMLTEYELVLGMSDGAIQTTEQNVLVKFVTSFREVDATLSDVYADVKAERNQ